MAKQKKASFCIFVLEDAGLEWVWALNDGKTGKTLSLSFNKFKTKHEAYRELEMIFDAKLVLSSDWQHYLMLTAKKARVISVYEQPYVFVF